MTTRTIIGSAYWASAIINGDRSGLDPAECAALDNWLKLELEDGEAIVSCGDEAFFSWSYGLHTRTDIGGGDLLAYTVLTPTKQENGK